MEDYRKDFIQFDKKKRKNETQNLAVYLTTHITFYIFLIFFAIFFVWYTAFISTHSFYTVKGPSMMPTFNSSITDEDYNNPKIDVQEITHDAVYVDRFSKAKIFDIIVIKKDYRTDPVIKRLMGVEGDYVTVAMDDSELFHFYRIPNGTNKNEITDEFALVDEESGKNGYKIKSYQEWTDYENRENNIEKIGNFTYLKNFVSNYLKLTKENLSDFESGNYSKIMSEREDLFISSTGLIYVKVPEKKFFYLGDNRAHSVDSLSQVDFDDVSQIIGRGEFIVYNYNFGNRLWEVIKFYFKEVEKFFAR